MKSIIYLCFVFSLIISVHSVAQTSSGQIKAKHVKKWFRKKEWLGELQLQPSKTINKKEFARQYNLNKNYWDEAFTFLKEHDLQSLAVGKYPVDGDNVYATVTQNKTKDYDSTQWESHRNFVDLQYVISGEEKMGISPPTKLTVTKPYDASKDVANYSGEGKLYTNVPGSFFLFFPSDAHRPNLTTGGNNADKKIVIKIRYAN